MVEVVVPAWVSHTGEAHRAVKPVDRCIAPLVRWLVGHGVPTAGSCCGHGRHLGSIVLADGRELVVNVTSMETRR